MNEIVKYNRGNIESVSKIFAITKKLIQNNNLINKTNLEEIQIVNDELVPFRNKNMWGYCTFNKTIVIDCKLYYANLFADNLASINNGCLNPVYINKKGDIVISRQDEPEIYRRRGDIGFFEVQNQNNKLSGIINSTGEEIVPIENDLIFPHFYSNEITCFLKNGKMGFVNLLNNNYVAPKYKTENIHPFNNGFFIISKEVNQKRFYGFMDKEENIIIPEIFSDANSFSEGLAGVKLTTNKWGFSNTKGELVIPTIYSYYRDFKDGIAQVKFNNKWGIINQLGEVIVPFIYEKMSPFSEGLAAVRYNFKWGFINKTGEIIIPFLYQENETWMNFEFKNGLACMRKNGKWGFIDKLGNEKIRFIYDEVSCFNEFGFALIKINSERNYIDKDGRLLISNKYSIVEPHVHSTDWENRFIVKSNEKFGVVDENGRIIVNCNFDNIWIVSNKLIFVEQGGKALGYINHEGQNYWSD